MSLIGISACLHVRYTCYRRRRVDCFPPRYYTNNYYWLVNLIAMIVKTDQSYGFLCDSPVERATEFLPSVVPDWHTQIYTSKKNTLSHWSFVLRLEIEALSLTLSCQWSVIKNISWASTSNVKLTTKQLDWLNYSSSIIDLKYTYWVHAQGFYIHCQY